MLGLSLDVKTIAINGIAPTSETISTRKYPLTTEVYAVVRKDTADDHDARRLRRWLLTAEGQAVVRESGYVPIRSGLKKNKQP